MDEDFLLNNQTAQALYHGTAEALPILDYHCHISPKEIAENKPLGFEAVSVVLSEGRTEAIRP